MLASSGDDPADGYIGSIAVDATNVYWTVQDLDTGSVMTVSLDGGTPVTLALGQNGPLGIALDVAHVYWTNWGFGNQNASTQNTVMEVPLDGGTPVVLASGGSPYSVAVDTSGVYYTVPGGYVMAAPLDGGAAQPLTPRSVDLSLCMRMPKPRSDLLDGCRSAKPTHCS
jgi:hypothetical protein